MSKSQKFVVKNKVGLHARPAAKFVKAAAEMKGSTVLIENLTKESAQVNAKSFTSVLSISVQQNDEVKLTVDGGDEEGLMAVFCKLFDTNFGEEE